MMIPAKNILFLYNGNAARSVIAEGYPAASGCGPLLWLFHRVNAKWKIKSFCVAGVEEIWD